VTHQEAKVLLGTPGTKDLNSTLLHQASLPQVLLGQTLHHNDSQANQFQDTNSGSSSSNNKSNSSSGSSKICSDIHSRCRCSIGDHCNSILCNSISKIHHQLLSFGTN
ncbi:unnamed protein product, partial [Meganyctiphanes norvegica]